MSRTIMVNGDVMLAPGPIELGIDLPFFRFNVERFHETVTAFFDFLNPTLRQLLLCAPLNLPWYNSDLFPLPFINNTTSYCNALIKA